MDTIFGKIIRKEIPVEVVYEDEDVLAFNDIAPVAPTHVLVIPKRYLKDLSGLQESDANLLGKLMLAVSKVVNKLGLDKGGFRVVVNNGAGAGQSVFHLHLHILAGRSFDWPPG